MITDYLYLSRAINYFFNVSPSDFNNLSPTYNILINGK